jgi:DNA-directed RNA polymerase subunit alpha
MTNEMELWDEIAIRVAAALAPQKNMLTAEQVANSAYAVAGAMMNRRREILDHMEELDKLEENRAQELERRREQDKKAQEESKNGTPLTELDLTVRAQNILRAESIYTIEQLCERRAMDLIRAPGMGKKSLNEIREVLRSRGLFLKGDEPNDDKQGG